MSFQRATAESESVIALRGPILLSTHEDFVQGSRAQRSDYCRPTTTSPREDWWDVGNIARCCSELRQPSCVLQRMMRNACACGRSGSKSRDFRDLGHFLTVPNAGWAVTDQPLQIENSTVHDAVRVGTICDSRTCNEEPRMASKMPLLVAMDSRVAESQLTELKPRWSMLALMAKRLEVIHRTVFLYIAQ